MNLLILLLIKKYTQEEEEEDPAVATRTANPFRVLKEADDRASCARKCISMQQWMTGG